MHESAVSNARGLFYETEDASNTSGFYRATPRGGIIFSEDDASGDGDSHPLAPGIADVNRLIGMGGPGEPFEFAVNLINDSEFAGARFSPDGRVMFVNVFGDGSKGSGMTCAIWGPWERGPL